MVQRGYIMVSWYSAGSRYVIFTYIIRRQNPPPPSAVALGFVPDNHAVEEELVQELDGWEREGKGEQYHTYA